jgi:hypothetical protein
MLNKVSSFFARHKGLPILIGIGLVVLNFLLQFAGLGWLSTSNVLLHLGVVLGLFGFLLAVALG